MGSTLHPAGFGCRGKVKAWDSFQTWCDNGRACFGGTQLVLPPKGFKLLFSKTTHPRKIKLVCPESLVGWLVFPTKGGTLLGTVDWQLWVWDTSHLLMFRKPGWQFRLVDYLPLYTRCFVHAKRIVSCGQNGDFLASRLDHFNDLWGLVFCPKLDHGRPWFRDEGVWVEGGWNLSGKRFQHFWDSVGGR